MTIAEAPVGLVPTKGRLLFRLWLQDASYHCVIQISHSIRKRRFSFGGTNITTTDNMDLYGTSDNMDVCISNCNSRYGGPELFICKVYFQGASETCTCYVRNTLSTPNCHTRLGAADPDYDTAVKQ